VPLAAMIAMVVIAAVMAVNWLRGKEGMPSPEPKAGTEGPGSKEAGN
jgi:hypothetical protein